LLTYKENEKKPSIKEKKKNAKEQHTIKKNETDVRLTQLARLQ
jgi:hypothetical protein